MRYGTNSGYLGGNPHHRPPLLSRAPPPVNASFATYRPRRGFTRHSQRSWISVQIFARNIDHGKTTRRGTYSGYLEGDPHYRPSRPKRPRCCHRHHCHRRYTFKEMFKPKWHRKGEGIEGAREGGREGSVSIGLSTVHLCCCMQVCTLCRVLLSADRRVKTLDISCKNSKKVVLNIVRALLKGL